MEQKTLPGNEVLGKRARDCVTQIEGIVMARTEHLNGCVRFCIQPQVSQSRPEQPANEVEWVDAQQLQVVGEGVRGEMGLDSPLSTATVSAVAGGPVKSEG